ncbi:unnamed protein product [Caenorhabditis bovis]|uniref:Coiled-coil domain-containing protein 149 n=1 Tax=Caenorhabditis bovis TaxID=2654633 RepID=A0A8S1ET80_9PELO|nr:unnamed protein product [Caenorhabditis bovis]
MKKSELLQTELSSCQKSLMFREQELNDMIVKYHKLADENKQLKRENNFLKSRNDELYAEKQELRKDYTKFRQSIAKLEHERAGSIEKNGTSVELGKFEELLKRYKQMESDLHTMLGVKEELLIERDTLQGKVSRLSNELSLLLNGDPKRVGEDLDSLIAENRFLKSRLNTAEEESEVIKSTLRKYKQMVEARNPQPSSSKSSNDKDPSAEERSSVAVINMKQIRELLASVSIELDESDYRAITTILLDLVNDKQMALTHLRRTNKILGTRLTEFEAKVALLEAKSKNSSPRHEVAAGEVEIQVPEILKTI